MPTPSEVVVLSKQKLKQACEHTIRQVLGNRSLGFGEISAAGNSTILRLQGAGAQAVTGEKFDLMALPFFQSESNEFWVSINIELCFYIDKYYLISLSIGIFEGVRYETLSNPLLRAEWMCTPEVGTYSHAQPHWHVYPITINELVSYHSESEQDVQDFGAVPEATAFGEDSTEEGKQEGLSGSTWRHAESFHFAMSALWDTGSKDVQRQVNNVDFVPKWLEGCLSYIHEQFRYLYG